MLRSRFRGSRIIRSLVVAAAGVATVLAVPATSWASPPEQGTFSSHEVYVDPDVCAPEGFPVDVVQDEAFHYQFFFDRTGAETLMLHIDYRAVISANGRTIVERDKLTEVFYPDGVRIIGNSVHIQGPDPGLVQHDAGLVIVNFSDQTVTIHGPHPQLEGQTWCFALLP